MKLIETRSAPNPRRVRIFIAEKGLIIPTQQLEFGNIRSAEFAQLNADQKVPVLQLDDGSVIGETVAICRYLEALHPEPALMGRGPQGQAVSEMWQRRVELGLFSAIAQCFRHLHPSMADYEVPQVPAWGEANRVRAAAALVKLDARLAQSPFIAGEAFEIADITALVAVDFMKPARIPRPVGLANLDRWYGEVSARPSARA
jgi:glutathione S-transferase